MVSGDEVTTTLTRTGDTLQVAGASTGEVPVSGLVRVLVDGPVLEVSSAGGLFGAAIAPAGTGLEITTTTGSIDVHPLT